jgi:ribonuclease HII
MRKWESYLNNDGRGNIRYVVGIDEAGRGPIAGPVSVGAVIMPVSFDTKFFEGVRDSKLLSAQKREEWFLKIKKEQSLGFVVSLVGASVIDREGIVEAIRRALSRSLASVVRGLSVSPKNTLVLLDGGLYAPEEYLHQKTIIRGDQSEAIISSASIVAKVRRDRYMTALSRSESAYGFERHKGYGTKEHFRLIKKHGVSDFHRKSFLKNLDF